MSVLKKFLKLSRLNGQDGFTLIEIVISIAVLSIASVFIMEMFIASANANLRAKNYDAALAKSAALLEEFKSGMEPEIENEFFSAEFFYDGDWNELPDESHASYRVEITAQMTENPSSPYPLAGRLYDVCVLAAELNSLGENSLLLELKTAKYFPD